MSKKSAYGVLFRELNAVSLSSLRDSRAGNSARKPCKARLPHPPHMSPDADYIWRASALQTSRKGFLTVCDGRAIFQPCIAVGEGHTMVSGFSQRSYKAVIQENLYFNIHFLLMIE